MQKIRRLGIKNYRSFGGDGVMLERLEHFNVIIGKNNSGKSNVLRFLSNLYLKQRGRPDVFTATDFYNNDNSKQIEYSISVESDYEPLKSLVEDGIYYKEVRFVGENETILDSFVRRAPQHAVDALNQQLFNIIGSESRSTLDPKIESYGAFNGYFVLPDLLYIPESRMNIPAPQLRSKIYAIYNYSATEAVRMRPIKEALTTFVEGLIGQKFEFKYPKGDDNEIELEFENGKNMPFSSLGAGIQQIIITAVDIAAAANTLILIDEPELNLHPSLLRKLIVLIAANTSNQYIVATHSNVLLDHKIEKQVYSIDLDKNEVSTIENVSKLENTRTILDNLGIRASEILQSNGIIWVEGPSDRTYINRWLELLNCPYKEGLDFTYQYYGGSLLAHYTLDDDIEQFVNVLEVSRNAIIVMDSDRNKKWEVKDLEPRKQRVIKEAHQKGILTWVTEGREIENYIPDNVWTSAEGKDSVLGFYDEADKQFKSYANKVVGSQTIAQFMVSDDIMNEDLLSKLELVIEKIKSWNT